MPGYGGFGGRIGEASFRHDGRGGRVLPGAAYRRGRGGGRNGRGRRCPCSLLGGGGDRGGRPWHRCPEQGRGSRDQRGVVRRGGQLQRRRVVRRPLRC